MRIVLCNLMASHCNPMTFDLRIPSFIVAFLGFIGGLCIMLPCSLGTYCISSSASRRAGGYNTLKPLKNFHPKYKRLNLFWVGPESKRVWAILKFAIQKSSSITSHAVVHLLQSTIVSNFFYCVECIHHTRAILPTSHNFWLMFANQLWADHFGTWLIAKLFYSVHKKLRTCGCGLQELRSCGLAVADSRILKRRCGLAVAD